MSYHIKEHIEEIIESMDPISLKQMDHVRLMRRRDSKYVVPAGAIPEILERVKDEYRVLEIDGKRIHEYETMYYDTSDFSMYYQHHNRRLNRYKVRVRKYVDTSLSFLEIKFKNNKGETIKKRIRPQSAGELSCQESDIFVRENSPYDLQQLNPALENSFKRITLVHITNPERITIDIDLRYSGVNGHGDEEIQGVSVIEVKKDRDLQHSSMVTTLRKAHYQAMGFSKYCIGTAMLRKDVKKNLFRPRIRQIEKLESSYIHHGY